ncbi:MAG TPA: SRPBCC family protein [Aldersonia sp.]
MVNRVTNEFEVDAEPARVMKALADIDGLPKWSSGHKNAKVETRWDDGKPRVVHAELSVVGASDHQILEYSWNGEESMRWELVQSTVQKSQTGTYTLTPTDSGGTHVKMEIEYELKIKMPGFVVNRAVKSALEHSAKKLPGFVANH